MKSILTSVIVFALLIVMTGADSFAQSRVKVYSGNLTHMGPVLGVSIQDVTPKLKEKKKLAVDEGALVTDVHEDRAAEKAGIEEGDVIVKFDGRAIYDADDLTRAVSKTKDEKDVSIELNRKGQTKTVTAKIEKPTKTHGYSYFFGDEGEGHFNVTPPTMPRVPRAPQVFGFNMNMGREIEGMEVQELNKQLAEYFEVSSGRGLLVTEVEKRSPAAEAGFKAGDVIVKVNNYAVRSIEDLREELYEESKSNAKIEFVRKGKTQTVTLKVEDRNDEWEEEDDDLSFDVDVPHLPYSDYASSRASISEMNKAFLNELQETLSSMQDKVRKKMRRLQERITEKVLNM